LWGCKCCCNSDYWRESDRDGKCCYDCCCEYEDRICAGCNGDGEYWGEDKFCGCFDWFVWAEKVGVWGICFGDGSYEIRELYGDWDDGKRK
jgi:hypothetical protein